jgi:PAS domain S-box-containing protein
LLFPITWDDSVLPIWSPAVGVGLALVAWFGRRFGLGVLGAAAALVVLRQLFRLHEDDGDVRLLWAALDSGLTVAEVAAAWWLFSDRARAGRRLIDPRSAMLFVLLVPGVTALTFAVVRAGLARLVGPPWAGGEPYWRLLLRLWLDHGLGMIVAAPPLLVMLTGWLAQRGLLRPEMTPPRGTRDGAITPSAGVVRWRWGDWLEVGGLALGGAILCLLLSRPVGASPLSFWGVVLLLIVWASLRQGLRGGTLVAAASAVPVLLLRQAWPPDDVPFAALLQAHLFAQCGAAVLIASATAWMRLNETGYRQVVSHIPVVIYSARLTRPQPPEAPPARPPATDDTRTDRGPLSETRKVGSGGHAVPPTAGLLQSAEITLVSAASIRLLGCPADELLGDYSRWLAFVHVDDREVLMAALEQLARQDQPVTCEYRLAGTDPGSSKRGLPGVDPARKARWLRDVLAPTRDPDGRLIGWEGVITDVTEQRALADDLRRTTSMFNGLVAHLPAGVFFIQGTQGHPILVNARARQLLGQREDASAGLEHLSRVYRLHRPDGTLYPVEELPVYQALKEGRATMKDDVVVHRPDGRRVPLVTWGAPVQLRSRGGPDAAVWVMEDLTALHQAEAARKDSEGRLRAVIETMAEGLVVLDARGLIVTTNPAACGLFGLTAERMRGRTMSALGWDYLRENGAPLPEEEHPVGLALRTGRPVRNVLLGVQPAGREEKEERKPSDSSFILQSTSFMRRWLLVNVMPLGAAVAGEGPRQAPAGVVATFSDLSAYVMARESIRVSEERYRGLVETLPMMLVQADRDRRLTYVNPATQQLTGYSLEEICDPAAWASILHPDDLPTVWEINSKALAGAAGRGECRYRAKDGSERHCFFICSPRLQHDEVVGTTTLLVDVTRERQLERELQRSQRLELIGRLSSGVAHDFNNLLGVVLNLAEAARTHLPPDHPVHLDLSRITEAGEQAASLAGQLLALARQRPGTLRRVDVGPVVRRTLELLRATLPAAITVESEVEGGELPIQGDETQVQQVLMNLCLNARDAMPKGGRLEVRARLDRAHPESEIEEKGERPEVRLTVRDSGTGMSAEVKARIFEPFYSTKEHGTGLGLAVVQQIVESYGGRISVQSSPGAGACFEVCWPALS